MESVETEDALEPLAAVPGVTLTLTLNVWTGDMPIAAPAVAVHALRRMLLAVPPGGASQAPRVKVSMGWKMDRPEMKELKQRLRAQLGYLVREVRDSQASAGVVPSVVMGDAAVAAAE